MACGALGGDPVNLVASKPSPSDRRYFLAIVCALALAGCNGSYTGTGGSSTTGGGSGGTGGGGGGGTQQFSTAQQLFDSRIHSNLGFCRNCHVPGGIADTDKGRRMMLSSNS